MRSSVLEPIEPVAPRMVRLRTSIRLPYQQAARGALQSAAREADQTAHERGGPEAIEPVHDAAVSRDETARVLDAEATLDRRLQEVAGLRRNRQQQGDGRDCRKIKRAGRLPGDGYDQGGAQCSANRAGPSLVWTDRGHELGSADAAATEVAQRIRGPDDGEQIKKRRKPITCVIAENDGSNDQDRGIADAAHDPKAALATREDRRSKRTERNDEYRRDRPISSSQDCRRCQRTGAGGKYQAVAV